MKNHSHHIIGTQKIEIEFENPVEAIGIQNHISGVFYERLAPEIEALFDDMFGNKYYASVDTLIIDCGLIPGKNWEEELVTVTIRKLKEELQSVSKKETFFQNAEDTFFFFLENGIVQWNNRLDSTDEIENLITFTPQFIIRLRQLIFNYPYAAERLAFRFSEIFCKQLINVFTKDFHADIKSIYEVLSKNEHLLTDKRIIRSAIFKTFSKPGEENKLNGFFVSIYNTVEEELQPKILNILSGIAGKPVNSNDITDIPGEIKYLKYENTLPDLFTEQTMPYDSGIKKFNEKNQVNKKNSGKTDNGIYIANAGSVILHPFFPEFFEHLGLTKDAHWINEQSQQRGTLLIEFLVSGTEKFQEFNLPLNKILCSIKLESVIKEDDAITEEMKDESEKLLYEVIGHWNVLKNTGTQALRETFLQRNGKLSQVDNGWLLQVEQKSVDILLGKLPWGIGIIKLPWMEQMLYVEWT